MLIQSGNQTPLTTLSTYWMSTAIVTASPPTSDQNDKLRAQRRW